MTTGSLKKYAHVPAEIQARAAQIKVLLMDVDGVMTDGKVYYLPGLDGQLSETKGFDTQDGLGLHICHAAGLVTGVVSGRRSLATAEHARVMRMRYVYQGTLEKDGPYQEILKDAGVSPEQVAFIGDDFTDVPLMRRSGLGVAVANARPEVKLAADYVTAACGGQGALRETIELILESQGIWGEVLKKYGLEAQDVS